ncbi:uncharacterized protein LTR77_010399 [Saxophila tyrrhenica]|uniref:EamA domain-containing protein n=1 Tax=Saxophila tyrrhenica TaxID=1690608 RepID=A0AAV9NXX1_9PEZI|nr:hypothetical protein LTR77_010399 [Saxophila tyrrhenica]
MSVPGPQSATLADKADISVIEATDRLENDANATPKLQPLLKSENLERNNAFLSAPLSAPIRPLSPDTLSNLSFDEYEAIRPGRSRHRSQDHARTLSLSPAPVIRGGIRGRFDKFWVRNKGLAYMLLAQIFGTLMNVTTRLLEIEGNRGKGMHPFQILFARMGITFFLASVYMWWKKTPHFPLGMPEVRGLLVARGLCGFFGVFGMYYSLLYLPLADATVITFLAPSLACWACSILINEPFTRVEKIAGLVSVVGVIFIAKPTTLFAGLSGGGDSPPASGNSNASPSGNGTTSETPGADAGSYEKVTPAQRLTAVGIALLGVLGSAAAYTTIRWIGKRAHPLLSVNYFAGWCFLVSIVMQVVLPDVGFVLPADLKEWGYLIFLGICGFVMQFLLAAGLAYEKSSRATNMTYTQMLFALGFDKLIFGHTPGVMSIIGSSLILSSALVVAIQQDPDRSQEQKDNAREGSVDEESRTGLMANVGESEDHDRLPVQEVHMRTLR